MTNIENGNKYSNFERWNMEKVNQLLYMKIMDFVKSKINDGSYLPEQQIPTEMDFAKEFQVSRITSRRALVELEREGYINRRKGSGSFVTKNEERVNSKHIEIQNNTNALRIISIFLPYEYNSGNLMETVLGASDYIKGKNYFLSIQNSTDNLAEEKEFLKEIEDGKIDGIIYYPLSDRVNLEFLTTLYMNGFPVVTIDKFFESIPLNSAISDNYEGSYMLTKHLIGLGHERIAFVSNVGIEDLSSVRDRYLGYCKALRDYNYKIDNDITIININEKIKKIDKELYEEVKHLKPISDSNKQEVFKDIIRKLLDNGVTAIQCVNDFTAMYILKACLEMKIEVPRQLSITGFDNIELSGHLEVPLTTIEQDFYSIGRSAAEMLIENIETGKNECRKVVLPVKLIERMSTAVRCVENRNKIG